MRSLQTGSNDASPLLKLFSVERQTGVKGPHVRKQERIMSQKLKEPEQLGSSCLHCVILVSHFSSFINLKASLVEAKPTGSWCTCLKRSFECCEH